MVHFIQSHGEIHRLSQPSDEDGRKEYKRIEEQLTQKVLLKIVGSKSDYCQVVYHVGKQHIDHPRWMSKHLCRVVLVLFGMQQSRRKCS